LGYSATAQWFVNGAITGTGVYRNLSFKIKNCTVMENASYYPTTESEQSGWNENFMTQLPAIAAKAKIPPDEITAQLAAQQGLLDSFESERVAFNNWKAALAAKNEQKKTVSGSTRKFVTRNIKSNPLCSDQDIDTLRVQSKPKTPLKDDHKPSITAVFTGTRVKLGFKKKGLQAMNIYRKRTGETVASLFITATQNPCYDTNPTTAAGVDQYVEYYGVPVVKNIEVGQPSDVVTVKVRS
jgi:hypothetical protein